MISTDGDQKGISSFSLPNSRLIITKLVAEDFKSYSGRHEIGPFHKSFTSIVGPNGSGKSNVIDAIMFVLGFRAKKMRQAKHADLIHNSSGMETVEKCRVQIYFQLIKDIETDSSEAFEPVPNSEFIVSRTAYRNNRNTYAINDEICTFQEVSTLLKGHGIDLDHKRFLILQGEVESIAQMKPKASNENEEGLLEYLEDIIGSSNYIESIEITMKELDQMNEKHSEKLLRTKIAEKECQSLEADKLNTENYLKLENELTIKRSELLQINQYQSEIKAEKLHQSIKKNKDILTTESEKCNLSEMSRLEVDIKEKDELLTNLTVKCNELQKQSNRLEKEDIELQERRKQYKTKIKALEKATFDTERKSAATQKDIELLNDEKKGLITHRESLKESLQVNEEELDKICSGLKYKTLKFQEQLEAKLESLEPFNQDLRREKQELDLANSKLNILTVASDNISSKNINDLTRLEKQLKNVEEEMEKNVISIEKTKSDLKIHKNQIISIRKDIERLTETKNNLAREITIMQNTLNEAKDFNNSNNSHSFNSISSTLDALTKHVKQQKIKGFHGRLGNLGTIDDQYDVAISTACSFLNHIVVDTTEIGQTCIEILKEKNLGRANFILLDKMKPAVLERPNNLPQESIRLFDLVKSRENKFLDAFYFALGNTLIAKDMKEANKWAYGSQQRFRVVTLDGKLIEASGTMSGGGQVQKGGMKSSMPLSLDTKEISKNDIENLEKLLDEKLEQVSLINQKNQDLSSLINDTQNQIVNLEITLKRLESLSSRLAGEREGLKGQIKEISLENNKNKNNKPTINASDSKEIKTLESIIKQKENSINKIKIQMQPLETEINNIQGQILNAGGTKYRVQKSKCDGIKEQIEHVNNKIIKIDHDLQVLLAKQSQLKGSSLVVEIDVSSQLNAIEERITIMTNEAITLQSQIKKLELEIDSINDSLAEMKKDYQQYTRQVAKFRKMEYELKVKIEQEEDELSDHQKTLEHIMADIKTLALHQIDDENDGNSFAKSVFHVYDVDDLKEMIRNIPEIQREIQIFQTRLEKIHPNFKILEEYKRKREIMMQNQSELSDLESILSMKRQEYESLCNQRHSIFMTGFREISQRLKEMYQLITMGGNAELELVDSLDPFSEGVIFSVMPPKKSWKNICNLSGGEKTISSLALIFALHCYKPTPIYVMDEIDAALDFRNVSIIANYIKERTKNAQFLIISLRSNMFEIADQLIGIYKVQDKTQNISLDPKRFNIKTDAC